MHDIATLYENYIFGCMIHFTQLIDFGWYSSYGTNELAKML
jgi:hypothetical protein